MFFYLSKLVSPILHPLFPAVLVFIYGIWRYHHRKKLRLLFLFWIHYILIISSPLVPWLVTLYEKQYAPVVLSPQADAVIVLGRNTHYFDKDHDQFYIRSHFARHIESLRLMKTGHYKYLIISGGEPFGHPSHWLGEAHAFAQLAQEMGIPKEKIIIEAESLNTYQEALFLPPLLKKYHIEKLVLVTSALHMPRSVEIFNKSKISIVPYPTDFTTIGFWSIHNINLLNELIHEIVGTLIYKIVGYA